jgi:methyl-accepting chemotaxis protein
MLATGTLLSRSISRPLDEAIGFAGRIAEGRLDADIACNDGDHTETGQLKRALRSMRDSLRRIVGEVRGGTDSIATAAGQIAAGNIDLSSRTESQAGALEETASSIEELTSTVRQNADNARQADQLARSASEVATRGGEVVGQVVQTMSAIDVAARRIVDIIGVIEGIAFQTNILALNAAVEAARAGEQGRGFAVVAGEVRNLAQRANSAAREIKGLIDDSVHQVDLGSRLVGEAGSTMREVVDERAPGERRDRRDQRRQPRAGRRHRPGQPRHRRDRRRDPAECRPGGRGQCGRERDAAAGRTAARPGRQFHARGGWQSAHRRCACRSRLALA